MGFANRSQRRVVGLAAALVALPLSAVRAGTDESLEGRWQLTLSEVSQNCGDPAAPDTVFEAEIQQSGPYLVLVPEDPIPSATELAGTVSGSSLSLGFELFDSPGITVYDSASSSLAIAGDGMSFAGNLPWGYYAGVDCSGVDNVSAVRDGVAPEPNSLTGSWQLTLSEVSENCGEGTGSPIQIDVEAVQFGDGHVRFLLPPVPGITEVVGTVSGQSLRMGLEVFEDGGVTVYDSQDNDLTIAPGFDAFEGDLPWSFFFPLDCTGVDSLSAVRVPEPGAARLAAAALLSVVAGVRRRGARIRDGRDADA